MFVPEMAPSEGAFASLGKRTLTVFSTGSHLRQLMRQPALFHLLGSLSLFVFGLSWLFRSSMSDNMPGTTGAAVVVWVLFVWSCLTVLAVVAVISGFSSNGVAQINLCLFARWSAWFLIATFPLQYLVYRAYSFRESSVDLTLLRSAESIVLMIHFAWTILFLAPLMFFFCSNTPLLTLSLSAVSAGIFPLLKFYSWILLFVIDCISLGVGIRTIFYVVGLIICVIVIVSLLYLMPWRTPEGNYLVILPFAVVALMIILEAAGNDTWYVVLIPLVGLALILLGIVWLCFFRNAVRPHKDGAETTDAQTFDLELYALSQAPNAIACELFLRTALRRRLGIRPFTPHSVLSGRMYPIAIDEGQALLQLYSSAMDVFPQSAFLATQFCILSHDLNITAGRAYSWPHTMSVFRVALLLRATSLWSASVAFQFFDAMRMLRATADSIGPDGAMNLRQMRMEMAALDNVRQEITATTAAFWKEILFVMSNAQLVQSAEVHSAKRRWWHRWFSRSMSSSIQTDYLWTILSRIDDLEARGKMILWRLERLPTVTPDVIRCRARWVAAVNHDLVLANKLLAQADTLEDHLTRVPQEILDRQNRRRPSRFSIASSASGPRSGSSQRPPIPPAYPSVVTGEQGLAAVPATPNEVATTEVVTGLDPDTSSTMEISSLSSASAKRLQELRGSVLSHRSTTITRMRIAVIGSLLVSTVLIIALFVLCREFIAPPVTQRLPDAERGKSTSSSSTRAVTEPLEAANRMRRPVAAMALVARGFTIPNFLTQAELDFYAFYLGRLGVAYRALFEILRVDPHRVEIDSYWSQNSAILVNFAAKQGTFNATSPVIPRFLFSYVFTSYSTVVRSLTPLVDTLLLCTTLPSEFGFPYYATNDVPFANPGGRCAELTLTVWVEALISVWAAFDNSVDRYQDETMDYIDDLLRIILALALTSFFVAFLLLVLVLIPSIWHAFRDRRKILFMFFEFDKNLLRKEYDAFVAEKNDDLGTRMPSAANPDSSDDERSVRQKTLITVSASKTDSSVNRMRHRRRSLFPALLMVIAIIIIMAYCQVFTILLTLYAADARNSSHEIRYMSTSIGMMMRSTAAIVEAFPSFRPSLLSLANTTEAQSVPVYVTAARNFANLGIAAWNNLLDGDGTNTTGIKDYSDQIRNAIFSMRTLSDYPSIYPDNLGRSLNDDMTATYQNVLTLSTNPADDALLNSVYRQRLFPRLVSTLPAKLDVLYSRFVDYYQQRSDLYILLANLFFGFAFLVVPLLYWLCFHRAVNHMEKMEMRLRKMLCTLDLETLQSNPRVVAYMTSGVLTKVPKTMLRPVASTTDGSPTDPSSSAAFPKNMEVSSAVSGTGPQWYLRSLPVAYCQVHAVREGAGKPWSLGIHEMNLNFLSVFNMTEFDALKAPLEQFFENDAGWEQFFAVVTAGDLVDMLHARRDYYLKGVRRPLRSGSRSGPSGPRIAQRASEESTNSVPRPPSSVTIAHDSAPISGPAGALESTSNHETFPCVVTLVPDPVLSDPETKRVFGLFIRDISEEMRQRALLELEKQRSTDLLLNMMPAPIVDRLKRNERPIAFRHKNVSIIFIDLVGFSTMCQERLAEGPSVIVELLDNLYSRFDTIADEHGVFKIKIIGDSFLGASGLHFSRMFREEQHDVDVQKEALSAVRFCIDAIKAANEFGLHVRCGVHTGPVVSGVISRTRLLYDIFGHSVNVAARLESTCPLQDHVHMSRETYELVYAFCDCQEVESNLKGIGKATTYLLVRMLDVPRPVE